VVKRVGIILLVLSFVFLVQAKVKYELWDDFEGKDTKWQAGTSWRTDAAAVGVELTGKQSTSGKQALACLVNILDVEEKYGQLAYMVENSAGWDFSNVEAVMLDIYNPLEKELEFALSFSTGNWTWYESVSVKLKPGWNKDLSFDLLDDRLWKAAESNWAYAIIPQNMHLVQRVSVLFYFKQAFNGAVYIDNLRFGTF